MKDVTKPATMISAPATLRGMACQIWKDSRPDLCKEEHIIITNPDAAQSDIVAISIKYLDNLPESVIEVSLIEKKLKTSSKCNIRTLADYHRESGTWLSASANFFDTFGHPEREVTYKQMLRFVSEQTGFECTGRCHVPLQISDAHFEIAPDKIRPQLEGFFDMIETTDIISPDSEVREAVSHKVKGVLGERFKSIKALTSDSGTKHIAAAK